MKKNTWLWVLVVVVVVAVGGYLVWHSSQSNKTATAPPSSPGAVVNNTVVITKTSSSAGSYLSDPSGRTLYTYASDTAGVSNCTGGCLSAWPAYTDSGATTGLPANISTIKRTDNGQVQYTYNGKPLYFFAGEAAGQVTGNGVSGFYVAKP
jgi:predicted lipoprotein with Yx(FWY)xxD motif